MTYSKAVQYEPVSWQAQLWPFPEQKLQPLPAVRVKFRNMSPRPFAARFILWWSPCLSCLKVSALITFSCFMCRFSHSHLSSYHVFPSPFSLHPGRIISSKLQTCTHSLHSVGLLWSVQTLNTPFLDHSLHLTLVLCVFSHDLLFLMEFSSFIDSEVCKC